MGINRYSEDGFEYVSGDDILAVAKDGKGLLIAGKVDIVPQPKQRPRFSTFRGHPHAYTPAKTLNYEKELHAWLIARLGAKWPAITGAISGFTAYVMPRPKSHKKSEVFVYTKPDIDNLEKCWYDALLLEPKLIEEDSRVVHSTATKVYENDKMSPSIRFVVLSTDRICAVAPDGMGTALGLSYGIAVVDPADAEAQGRYDCCIAWSGETPCTGIPVVGTFPPRLILV